MFFSKHKHEAGLRFASLVLIGFRLGLFSSFLHWLSGCNPKETTYQGHYVVTLEGL